jgi:tRNA pseudouridine-54 N-methylase
MPNSQVEGLGVDEPDARAGLDQELGLLALAARALRRAASSPRMERTLPGWWRRSRELEALHKGAGREAMMSTGRETGATLRNKSASSSHLVADEHVLGSPTRVVTPPRAGPPRRAS